MCSFAVGFLIFEIDFLDIFKLQSIDIRVSIDTECAEGMRDQSIVPVSLDFVSRTFSKNEGESH